SRYREIQVSESSWRSPLIRSPVTPTMAALRGPVCSSVRQGPAGSHKSALKRFLSVSELATAMSTVYVLGPFRLDTEAQTLFRGAEPVALGQRAVAVLRVLVERPRSPVSKDALMDAAWAGVNVEESNLAVQISALRRALGEAPDGDGWIETLP